MSVEHGVPSAVGFVAVVGPPAVRKSTVSGALADRFGARVFRLHEFAHEFRTRSGVNQRLFDTGDPLGWLPEETVSGLHAAHTAGDRSVGAYLLVCMTQAAVHRGRLEDGIDLGRAARDAVELANAAYEAARPTPAAVRALAASRFALAQASVRNARGFHTAADEARALLDAPGALDTRPPYLAWFGPATLKGQLAQGALTLGEVTSRPRRDLLNGAEVVLGRIATHPAAAPCAAVFYAAGLARAHVAAGALDRAVPAAQLALRQLPTVRSRRCALVLRRLEDDLAALPPTRHPASVRSLQDQLRASHAN